MKVSNAKGPSSTVTFATKAPKDSKQVFSWWKAATKKDTADQLIATAAYLKETQGYRFRQAAIYARLYGNMSLFNFIGSNSAKLDHASGLPTDRPTFNVIQSGIDTLVSRIGQSRPSPVFLTDNSDWKERRLAKQLNSFILGEFYQAKAYDMGTIVLRDALVEGTGCIKIFETPEGKVGLERRLLTELLTDPNESIYGKPRQLYEIKLVDRAVLADTFPGAATKISVAEAAYPDNSGDSSKTVSDLVMVVEGWHLKSGPNAKDGRHTIACSTGVLIDEDYTKDDFPFVFLHYSPRLLGFWAQGLAEQLMGTQMEINQLLYTISKAIRLVGVPRIFQEKGSKVSKASHNNDIGAIIEYSGTKPEYVVAQSNAPELYTQLQRLIEYAYQQSGVSNMQATGQKPQGLDSGEAQRVYDDISTDRFATLARRYDNLYIDLSYKIIDLAKDICERDGSYSTVYPDQKTGRKEVDLPEASLLEDSFVIQCFNESSLPRDPAGRMQRVVEMSQSGMIDIKEARRLLNFPDIEQMDKLESAAEERIFQILDLIVEEGQFTPPDPFTDLQLATKLTTQYINQYSQCKLEEEKLQQLRDFFTQCQALTQQAMAPPPGAAPGMPPGAPGGTGPLGVPEAPPTSAMLPNAPKTS